MKQPSKLWSTSRTISLFGLILLLVSGRGVASGADEVREEDFRIPFWNYSAALRGGVGYKDNVLLSHTNAQGSAFWSSSAELMVFRLPSGGWQFTSFVDASDVRYFDAPTVDNEQVALAVTQLSKDFDNGWKSTLGLTYMFQNQVYDNSANYTNQTSVGLIMGHTLTPRWALRKTFDQFWAEGEISGTRQWLDAPLDSYWQFGPRMTLGYGWGRGSELTLSYQYTRLDYDHREQASRTGAPITNTVLALTANLVEISLTQFWDEKRNWQTITTAGFETSHDNGSGFYDYDYFRLSTRARYRDEKWEVTSSARLGYYSYSVQTVSDVDTDLRRKTMINLMLRAERKLTKHLMAHVSYGWDCSMSNLDFDDYQASTVIGGLALSFE